MNLGVTELKIEAVSNEETATVEILGNENFQDGENTVTIIVSSKDGENKVTYQIKANRKEKVVEASSKDNKNKDGYIDNKVFLYIAIGAAVLIALIIVVVYTIKHRNTDELDKEEEYDYFTDKVLKEEKEDEEIEEYKPNKRKKGKHF